jgi:DNA-binding transcriptional regulator PaaX
MDYNQLKSLILRIIRLHGSIDASSILKQLHSEEINVDIHAVRMALMRYHRYGLLKRERKGGRFSYSLSERGVARLGWLEQQAKSKMQ